MTDEKETDTEVSEQVSAQMDEPTKAVEVTENETAEAVRILCRSIKADPDFWRTWQANIAMAYKDEYERNKNLKTPVHIIANNAARNFLMQLCEGVE